MQSSAFSRACNSYSHTHKCNAECIWRELIKIHKQNLHNNENKTNKKTIERFQWLSFEVQVCFRPVQMQMPNE